MLLLSKRIPHGQGLAAALLRRASSLALDWATRQKSRFDARLSNDEHVGVFLPRGHVLRGGDVLVAEDGRLVSVVAADEAVYVVSAPATLNPADAAHALMRGAYHLGNRHVMLSLQSGRLVMEPDAVLGEMLKGLGLEVREAREPFEPEGGAYGDHRSGHEHGHGHGHHHHHDHGDGHGHAHSHQEALGR